MRLKKRYSLIEGIMSILLFVLILSSLRYIIFDSNIYIKSIKFNNNKIVNMQNVFLYLDKDFNYAYKTEFLNDKVIIETPFETVIYEKRESGLYRNNHKILDLTDINIYFSDASLEVNNENGKRIIKIEIFYTKKNKLENSKIYFKKYIATQEKL